MNQTNFATVLPRSVQRVRHALKMRVLTVRRTEQLSPHFLRVTFYGDSLGDFVTASFDDHVKLMLPAEAGQPFVLPAEGPNGPNGPNGLTLPEGAARPTMRDYTPRRFDADAGELDIEFALHGDGPAARWAAQAAPGQQAGIGGPRSSFIVPLDWDWHLLIGDESALPAIARRLEELPAGASAVAVVETGDPADRRELNSKADVQLHWVDRRVGGSLAEATRTLQLPRGEGYAWAAGEAAAMAATRRVLVETFGLDKDHVRAAAYWKRGAAGHHENL